MSIGRSDCHIVFIADSQENQVRCELYIPGSKELYNTLFSNKVQIEKELALSELLDWQELPGKKAARIRLFHDFKFTDPTTWNDAVKWLIETAIRFKKVFSKT